MVCKQVMEKVQRLIITGASGSVGSQTVRSMASQGYSVIMACRNLKKGEAVKESILKDIPAANLEVRLLNLEDLASVVEFVKGIERDNIQVVKLFNNAGIINRSFGLSPQGFEKTISTNYIGPAFLTMLLVPFMAPDGEIVNMVSLTCALTSISANLFNTDASAFSQLGTYSKTKLALLLFSIELSKHIKQRVNVSDPGIVNSNMLIMGRWYDAIAAVVFCPFCASPKRGARSAINALSSNKQLNYFKGNSSKAIKKKYMNNPMREWVWKETLQLIQQKGFELPQEFK